MNIEDKVIKKFPIIKRARLLDSGFIAEIKSSRTENQEEWKKAMTTQIRNYIWDEFNEVTYALYFFKDDEERFCLEGTLRTVPSTQAFNMSTSTLSANDIFGKFTRFDFDVLTLSQRDDRAVILFTIDPTSPTNNILSKFQELDLMGHQFPVRSKVKDLTGGYYEVSMDAGLDFV